MAAICRALLVGFELPVRDGHLPEHPDFKILSLDQLLQAFVLILHLLETLMIKGLHFGFDIPEDAGDILADEVIRFHWGPPGESHFGSISGFTDRAANAVPGRESKVRNGAGSPGTCSGGTALSLPDAANKGDKTMVEKMPALFLGHGNPMNALRMNRYSQGWRNLGVHLRRPEAVLAISAHWYVDRTATTGNSSPETIHDFYGFPQELFRMSYPAPGNPALALKVSELLHSVGATVDGRRGLDHGAWAVLCHLFPDADIPVVQLSIDSTKPPEFHYQVGRLLRPLRDEGVLVIGSGNLVHNLHAYRWNDQECEPYAWAIEFEAESRMLMLAGRGAQLVDYLGMGETAKLACPTPDHFLPLLYILGLQEEGEPVSFPVDGIDGGSVSMLAVRIG